MFEPVPVVGAALVFDLEIGADPRPGLEAIRSEPARGDVVIGIGEPLARALGAVPPGLRVFPSLSGVGFGLPATQGALWAYFRGDERGAVLDRATTIAR